MHGEIMKTKNLKIAAVLFLAFAPVLPAAVSAAVPDKEINGLSREIIDYAQAHGLGRIALSGFSALGGAENEEAYSVSEKIGENLAGRNEASIMGKVSLEKVMAEVKHPSSGASAEAQAALLRNIFAADVMVTGTVFAAGKNIKIMVRLSDIKTGRVLLTAKAEAGKERKGSAAPASMKMPGFPGPYQWWGAAGLRPVLPPADLRDALSEHRDNSCSERKKQIAQLNAELVDAKARYWAAKMAERRFSSLTLRNTPGVEIADPRVKTEFYKLLTSYYKTGNSALTEPGRLSAVLDLLGAETHFFTECEF
jgi:hypothetical protein